MIALDAPTVVPGHGPITDGDGIRAVRGYLVHIAEQAEAAYRKGLSFVEAADTIDLGEYASWLDAERVVINVYTRYRELDSDTPQFPRWGCWPCRPSGWPSAHKVGSASRPSHN